MTDDEIEKIAVAIWTSETVEFSKTLRRTSEKWADWSEEAKAKYRKYARAAASALPSPSDKAE